MNGSKHDDKFYDDVSLPITTIEKGSAEGGALIKEAP